MQCIKSASTDLDKIFNAKEDIPPVTANGIFPHGYRIGATSLIEPIPWVETVGNTPTQGLDAAPCNKGYSECTLAITMVGDQ